MSPFALPGVLSLGKGHSIRKIWNGVDPEETMKTTKGLQHLSYENGLKDLCSLSLEKRMLSSNLTANTSNTIKGHINKLKRNSLPG